MLWWFAGLAPIIAAGGIALIFYLGDAPQLVGRLLPLDLTSAGQLFRDWRIAALRNDRDLCARVLTVPGVRFKPVDDKASVDGCGWINAVRLDAAAGVTLGADPISCPMAAGIALWLAHEVQPAALRRFGQPVISLRSLGSFACRDMIGDAYSKHLRSLGLTPPRSQHAQANAFDIAGFELANGKSISVLVDWRKSGQAEAEFLHDVHEGACRFFHVVLGPDANPAHANHFHLDRGPFLACR